MEEHTLSFGPRTSPFRRCRWWGCKPEPAQAVIRIRLCHANGAWHNWSELQSVQQCTRCRQVTTAIDVPFLPGDAVDSVTIEVEEGASA